MSLMAPGCEAAADSCHQYSTAHKISGRRVVMLKKQKRLCYYNDKILVLSTRASYGRSEGKKHFRGDNRTPEGRYTLSPARPSKQYGLFLTISYPNQSDQEYARKRGRHPGSAVGIHGPQRWYAFLGGAQSLFNHSRGCIVLDEESIKKLAALVKRPVELLIVP